MDAERLMSYLRETEILLAPKRALSTFGATRIAYHMISPVENLSHKTRLREGTVVSQRPLVITPDAFIERFQGFGDEAKEFAAWVNRQYRELLRALEYNFKNQGFATRVISEPPQAVCDRIVAELGGGAPDEAVIRCPDGGWSLALMKFTLDESARSFPVHVRDLERRGLFDPAGKSEQRRRREIEELFDRAALDPAAVEPLGAKLREYGLFAEYEDRYLSFFR